MNSRVSIVSFVCGFCLAGYHPEVLFALAFQKFTPGDTVIVIIEGKVVDENGREWPLFPGLAMTVEQTRATEAGPEEVLVNGSFQKWMSASDLRLPKDALKEFDTRIKQNPQDLDALYAKGLTFAAIGEHENAIQVLREYQSARPNEIGPLNELAYSLMRLDRNEEAMELFDKVMEIGPTAETCFNRGICAELLGQTMKARTSIQQAIELDKRLKIAWETLLHIESNSGNHSEAIEVCNRYLAEFPDESQWLVRRANLHFQKGAPESAITDLKRACELDSGQIDARNNLAILLRDTGQATEAVNHLSAIIQEFPDHPTAWINRGLIMETAGRWDEARADLSRAMELSPGDRAFLLFHRSKAEKGAGNREKALRDLTEAVSINPLPQGFIERSLLHESAGNLDLALMDLNQALEKSPEHTGATWNRARVHRSMGNLQEALVDYERLIAARPDTPEVYICRSHVLAGLKDWERAVKGMREAQSRIPDQPEIMDFLALLLAACPDEAMRRPLEAIALANKTCEITDWKEPAYIETLAIAHAANGDFPKAVELTEKAVALADPELASQLKNNLEKFRDRKPYVFEF